MSRSALTMLQQNPTDNEQTKREDKNVRMLIRVTDRALGRLAKRSNTVFAVHDSCGGKDGKK